MVMAIIAGILAVVVVGGIAGSALWVIQWRRKLQDLGILKGKR